MIKNFTPPLIFGLFLGFAWQHFEWLFWLNFIGFTYPYLWIKSPNTTSVKVAQMLLFLLPWFTIGGFWLNSYNTNLYLFGVGVYSLLYALPFLMTIAVTKKLQQKFHVLSFLIFFLAVEYIQEAFHPFVPWFNLGNGFAASSFQIPILQILGSRGVSLMVLVIAFMLGKSYLNNKAKQPKRQFHWLLILPFILPYLKSHEVIESAKEKVLFIQPHKQINHQLKTNEILFQLSEENLTKVSLALAPESFFDTTVGDEFSEFQKVSSTFKSQNIPFYFGYVQNSPYKNLILNSSFDTVYEKQRPVPVVEANIFSNLSSTHKNADFAICSEAVYANLFQEKAKKTSGKVMMFSNDIWFENSSAFKHHALMLRLRAAETGNTIYSVANSGLSGIFLPNGEFQLIDKQKLVDIKTIVPIEINTSFADYGDVLGRLSLLFAPFLILYAFTLRAKF